MVSGGSHVFSSSLTLPRHHRSENWTIHSFRCWANELVSKLCPGALDASRREPTHRTYSKLRKERSGGTLRIGISPKQSALQRIQTRAAGWKTVGGGNGPGPSSVLHR